MYINKSKLIGIVFFFVVYYLFNNFFLQSMVIGTYINVNYKESPFLNSLDTLILAEDSTFYSEKFGHGNYKIFYTFTGTKIHFSEPQNRYLHVNRTWDGRPKINIYFDLAHHYRKESSDGRISIATKEKVIKRAIEEKERIKEMQKRIQKEMYE